MKDILSAVVVLLMSAQVSWSDTVFKMTYCNELESSVHIVFRDDHSARSVTFMGNYEGLAIKRPEFKGLLSWNKIRSVELKILDDERKGILNIVYAYEATSDQPSNVMEFGELDIDCWNHLKSRFQSKLSFVEHNST